MHTYTNTFTLSTCTSIHQTFLIQLHNWLNKNDFTNDKVAFLTRNKPNLWYIGNLLSSEWFPGLTSQGCFSSLRPSFLSTNKRFYGTSAADDLMIDGERYLRIGKDLRKIHGCFLILIRIIRAKLFVKLSFLAHKLNKRFQLFHRKLASLPTHDHNFHCLSS